jgi:hypothetical protein
MPSLCWASRRANDKDGLLTRMDRACSGLCCHQRVRVERGVCMVGGGGEGGRGGKGERGWGVGGVSMLEFEE